jgi:hypothetical protein
MAIFTRLARAVFAAFNSNGQARKISPQETEIWGTEVERNIEGAAAGYVVFSTWAALTSVPGTRWGQPGRVTGPDAGSHTDPVAGGTVPNEGEYWWSVSPAGWRRSGNLERWLVHALNTGEGTANAVEAITDISFDPSPYKALITINFTAANSGAMTVSLDGEPPLDLVTNIGEPTPSGYVQPGMSALVQVDNNGDYRMFSYGDATAIQAAAEAAAAAAQSWAELAESAYTALATGVVPFGPFDGDGVETEFALPIAPIISANCAVFINGVFQDYAARSIAGTTLTFTEPPPEDTTISGVIFAPVDDIVTPPAGSVSALAIDSGDAVNIRSALAVYSEAEADALLDEKADGPASSVSGNAATFSGTSGKVLQDSGVALDNSAWTSFASTVTASSGTLTTATGTIHYKIIGKTAFFRARAVIADAGGGAGNIQMTTPWSIAAQTAGAGKEVAAVGLQVNWQTSGNDLVIAKYDNTTIIATGRTVVCSGVIELA